MDFAVVAAAAAAAGTSPDDAVVSDDAAEAAAAGAATSAAGAAGRLAATGREEAIRWAPSGVLCRLLQGQGAWEVCSAGVRRRTWAAAVGLLAAVLTMW